MIYEIVIGGYFHEAWFEGFAIMKQHDFSTKIRGQFIDQSALYGMLRRIHDLGAELISVNRIDDEGG
jgi:hypothetical protein